MLQRTHNCNDAEIAEVSSICAFAIRPREQQHCRVCRKWSAKNRTEATASRRTDRQRDNKINTHREGQTEQPREEKRRATMRQTETSNNTTNKQDKTREQQIIRQIKLKKKRRRK